MRTPLAVLALALGAVFVPPAAAFAAPVVSSYEEPAVGTGTVSTGTVGVGGTVEFCGEGFAPGSTVDISVDGEVVGSVVAGTDGSFCVDVVLGETGTHVLSGSGVAPGGRSLVVNASVTVTRTAAAPVRSGGSGTSGRNVTVRSGSDVSRLPRTGADGTATQVWAGVGLLGLGGGLVALTVARRRDSATTAG